MAEVDVVATYELFYIKRSKLEGLLHRFFESAKLNIEINDRFGKPVKPQAWFLVPLPIIDEAVTKVIDGGITQMAYDSATASPRSTHSS